MTPRGGEVTMAKRPTMSDIARQVGVSRVAVSYALNGLPGVSEDVRARVRAVADELGFSVNRSARALHGASSAAIGLTLNRSSPAFSVEVFRRQLIAGIQTELASRAFGLALQFVGTIDEELAVYRRWHAERRVDGVIILDVRIDDPRITAIRELGLPAMVIGGTGELAGVANLWIDERPAATKIVTYLASLGHRRLVRVSGPPDALHTKARTDAIAKACARSGISVSVVAADYSGDVGAVTTRRILSSPQRPTAILYDNDLMAVAGLGVAFEMNIPVPSALSIMAWEDSPICQVVHPAITVLKRDINDLGVRATKQLFEHLDGRPARSAQFRGTTLVVRESSAAPGG